MFRPSVHEQKEHSSQVLDPFALRVINNCCPWSDVESCVSLYIFLIFGRKESFLSAPEGGTL